MSASKEPRSDSVLGNLPQNQRDQLDYWLFEEKPKVLDAQILERLRLDFSVSVSPSMLSRWKKFRKAERRLNEVVTITERANAINDRFEKNPADTYTALRKLITALAVMKADDEESDDETISNLAHLAIKFKREETRGDMAQVLRAKFQRETAELFVKWYADQRAKDVLASSEPNTAKIERLGTLMFGELWGGSSTPRA